MENLEEYILDGIKYASLYTQKGVTESEFMNYLNRMKSKDPNTKLINSDNFDSTTRKLERDGKLFVDDSGVPARYYLIDKS
jgi:hypothetical protein